jgi:uncharacterized protein (TIGR03435 family)
VAKGGPKIKPDNGQGLSSRWNLQPGQMIAGFNPRERTNSIEGRAIPIERLISNLLNQAGRPIIDRTNLKGLYTFIFKWPEEGSDSGDSPLARKSLPLGPAFFTALEEQLGLRLESAKGPVEYLVIRSVQKPVGIK